MTRRIGIIIAGIVTLLLLVGLGYLIYRFFAGGTGTITIWTLPGNENAIKRVAEIYRQKHPSYRVKIVPVTEQNYETQSLFALASQQGTNDLPVPDVWVVPNEWLTLHRNKLIPAPDGALDNGISSYKAKRPRGESPPPFPPDGRSNTQIIEEDYAAIAKQDLVKDNQVWGVPLSIDTLALFYDQSTVSTPPKTWQEVVDLTKRLTERSGDTITRSAVALGDNESVNHFVDILSILMLQSGTQMVDEATNTATFNISKEGTPPGTSALDFYTSFARPRKETYTWNKSLGTSLRALKDGKSLMAFGYLSDVTAIGVNDTSRIRVATLPQTNPNKPQTYGRYLVATVTKQAQSGNNTAKARAAWDFVALFANPDVASLYTAELRQPPARIDVAKRTNAGATIKPFLDQVPTAVNWQKKEVKVADGALNESLTLVLKNGEPAQKAIDVAAKGYTTFLQAPSGIETDPAVLSLWQSSDDTTDYRQFTRDFLAENSDIKRVAITEHASDRYEWEVLNAMAARQGPDILLLPNDHMPRFSPTLNAYPSGSLNPSGGRVNDLLAFERVYVPAVKTDNIVENKIYGVPAHLETLMIAYNNTLYRESTQELSRARELELDRGAGLDSQTRSTPLLWDDLKAITKSVVKRNGAILERPFIALGTGSNVVHADDLFAALVKQFGGDITDPDRNVTGIHLPRSSQDTTVAGKQAEDLLKGFNRPENDYYTWNSSMPNSLEALADGKVIAAFIYPRDVKKITDRNPLIDLKFFPLPQLDINREPVDIASYYSFTIPRSSKNPEAALTFIRFVIESQTSDVSGQGITSPRQSQTELKVIDRVESGDPQRLQKNSAQSYFKGNFPNEVNAAFIDLMDGRATLDQAANRINESLKKSVL